MPRSPATGTIGRIDESLVVRLQGWPRHPCRCFSSLPPFPRLPIDLEPLARGASPLPVRGDVDGRGLAGEDVDRQAQVDAGRGLGGSFARRPLLRVPPEMEQIPSCDLGLDLVVVAETP